MNLQLKNIKHAAFASQETHCYSGTLYLDGKAVAVVGNDGHGGCDRVDPVKHDAASIAIFKGAIEKITAHFEAQPEKDTGIQNGDGTPYMAKDSLESWCCDQVNLWLAIKDMKRAMKAALLFTKNNGEAGIFNVKISSSDSKERATKWIRDKYPNACILNDLPEQEALAIWRS